MPPKPGKAPPPKPASNDEEEKKKTAGSGKKSPEEDKKKKPDPKKKKEEEEEDEEGDEEEVTDEESEEDEDDDDDDDDEGEGEDEMVEVVDLMKDYPVVRRRKVYAMKGLLKEYRVLHRQMLNELAQAEKEHETATADLREERRRIIAGEREVTPAEMESYKTTKNESGVEEIPSDDEGEAKDDKAKNEATKKEEEAKKNVKVVSKSDEKIFGDLQGAAASSTGGIPGFWLGAMLNNEVLEGMITERDGPALRHLKDVTKNYLDGDPLKGFELHFHFAPNEYFSKTTLSKQYIYDQDDKERDDDDPLLDTIKGCDIDWSSSEKNLTVIQKQKKQRHKKGKGVRVVTREEPCPSFFNFFKAPVPPKERGEDAVEITGEEEDEEAEDYDSAMNMDYEAASALSDTVIPRAIHYYTGKSVEQMATKMSEGMFGGLGDDDDDDDDEDEDDDEEDDEPTPPMRGGRGKGGPKGGPRGRGGGKGGGGQQDCKQQ